MEKFLILKAMHEEHRELQAMINKAVDGFEIEKGDCENIFKEFKEKLEKHFSLEEKAIYAISKKLDSELEQLIRKIFSEHALMRVQIKSIGDCIASGKRAQLVEFLSTLQQHHALEDLKLYPRLDKELDQDEKIVFKNEFYGKK